MTARLVIIILLATFSSELIACQCARGLGRNFLNKVKKFDAIVLGTYNSDNNGFQISFTVDKVYKGNLDQEKIELLAGGTDCMHSLYFENGTQLVLGLVNSPYSGNPDAFMAFGCSTSAIIVEGEKVFTAEQQLPMFGKPRIGILRRKMSLRQLEQRIKSEA